MNKIVQQYDGKDKLYPTSVSDAIIVHGLSTDFDSDGMTLTDVLNQLLRSGEIRFLHLSDTHKDAKGIIAANNLMNQDKSKYDFALITGDLQLTSDMKALVESNPKMLLMLGNHDTIDDFVNNQKKTRDNYIAPYMATRAIMGDDEEIGSYWYKDIKSGNTILRLIAFDEYEYTRLSNPNSPHAVVRSEKQINWFIDLLKNTPSDYYLALAHHQPPSEKRDDVKGKFTSSKAPLHYYYQGIKERDVNACDADLIPEIIDCYCGKKIFSGTYKCGDVNGTSMTFNVDFASVNPAHFLFHIAGHTHYDACEYLKNYPNQLLLVVDQCRQAVDVGSDLLRDTTNRAYCINDVTISVKENNIVIRRIGAQDTSDGSIRDTMTFPITKGKQK